MHAAVASLVASVCVGHGNLVLIWHKLLSTIALALVCILDNKRPQHLASHYKMQNQLCFVVCVCVWSAAVPQLNYRRMFWELVGV